jgi:hypothetical protein
MQVIQAQMARYVTKLGTGVQAIFRFRINDLRGCNAGTTMGGIYEIANAMASDNMILYTKFHKDWFRRSNIVKGRYTYIHTYIHTVTAR